MPQLLYDDSDALRLTWKPPVTDTKRPLRYQVQMQAPQSMDWRPLATGITDNSYRIDHVLLLRFLIKKKALLYTHIPGSGLL